MKFDKPGPSPAEIKFDLGSTRPEDISAVRGAQRYALGFASVVKVNPKRHTCLLRIETGETFTVDVPLSYPGAGARHFFGAMPMVGDVCIVGWRASESGVLRKPVVLSWVIPGIRAGYQWMPTQPFSPEEYSQTPSDRVRQEGVADLIRHKLRHMEPGNIVASSAQGSDLVLDESATLSNRRANEIRLRDSDQAIVFRSLQQFHAGAGFRVYSGMVQRDASLLPRQMFSDGRDWASLVQVDENGEPLFYADLPASEKGPGALTPHPVFDTFEFDPSSEVDPKVFLQKGMFVSDSGVRSTVGVPPDAGVYGGKVVYRVARPPGSENAFHNTDVEALTEYRIEVAHTSDGVLPVTEQTDNFDADRIPHVDPRVSGEEAPSEATPFIEVVYGSVIGNDPFSLKGRAQYGKPLRPEVFGDGRGDPNPDLVAGDLGDLGAHAAMLFRMGSPVDRESQTWWSVTKSGRFLASVSSPVGPWSVEVATTSGVRAWAGASDTGESWSLEGDGGVSIQSGGGRNEDNAGFHVTTRGGGVLIRAEGALNTGREARSAGKAADGGESNQESMVLSAASVMRLEASRIRLAAPSMELGDSSSITLTSSSDLSLSSGSTLRGSARDVDLTVSGKFQLNVTGPKNGDPTNSPYVSESISSLVPTVASVKETNVVTGTVKTSITAGHHEVFVTKGDINSSTLTGKVAAEAGKSSLSLSSLQGLDGNVVVGGVGIKASAGSTTIKGSVSVTVSTNGQAKVRGGAGVTLLGPGHKGRIISSMDRDPLTGKPFSLYGMGSPGHRLG